MQLMAVGNDVLRVFLENVQFIHGFSNAYRTVLDQVGQRHGAIRHAGRVVQDHALGTAVDVIGHIVHAAGQLIDVFPVKRCDEGFVQFVKDTVGQDIPLLFLFLDFLVVIGCCGVVVVRDEFDQEIGGFDHHFRHFFQDGKELGFFRSEFAKDRITHDV
jgi:hypothetical protein